MSGAAGVAGTAGPLAGLGQMLDPRSVVVIGASERPGNLGGTAVRLLGKFGFRGPVWPVHPTLTAVHGLRAYRAPADVPGVADVAILAVPADGLLAAIEECANAGIRHGISWAGGFAEAGGEGVARQQELAALCRRLDFKLLGPNCLGVVNAASGFTGTFTSALLDLDSLAPGSVSMVSQSGGIGTNANAIAHRAGFGFRYMISCGNEAVLTVADFLRALVQDPETRVIALYVEAVNDGAAFIAALDAAYRARKPVVVMKGGATSSSERATVAHTGRFAGVDRVFDAVFRETAAIRVHSLEEMLDVALLISTLGQAELPRGPNVVLPTFGGGGGVLASDQCDRAGLRVPELTEETRSRLEGRLTPLASLENPVDLTPQSVNDPRWLALLPDALGIVHADANVDSMLFLGAAMKHREMEVIGVIERLRQGSTKPVVVCWTNASVNATAELQRIGVHSFTDSGRAAHALGHLVRYAARLTELEGTELEAAGSPASATTGQRHAAAQPPRFAPIAGVNPEHIAADLLRSWGLPVAEGRLATTAQEAAEAADAIGFPVAVKAVSGEIAHRAAAGFVALNVAAAEEVANVFERLQAKASAQGTPLDGCYIQRMARPGVELLVSAFRDPIFGPVVVCGAGGVLTELIGDVWLARAPVDRATATKRLRAMRLANHASTRLDPQMMEHAVRFLVAFSHAVADLKWPRYTLEVNPLMCSPEQAIAVDGLLVIDEL